MRTSSINSAGFTLLEVMMATALLAVGAVSVLVVLASAAGFASQRQAQQRLTQVVEEARHEARAIANSFQPSSTAQRPGGDDGKTEIKQSTLYPGYGYELAFAFVDRDVPEAGYDVVVTVRYGDGLEHAEQLVVASDTIPDEEFAVSRTYEEERAGLDDREGRRETR
jgi:prepilin-type N-terminal cleavage/methylation domain-containing protein